MKNDARFSYNRFIILLIFLIPCNIQVERQSTKKVSHYFLSKENFKSIEFYIGSFNLDTVKVIFIKSEQVEKEYFNSPQIYIGKTRLKGKFLYNDLIMDSLSVKIICNNYMGYILLRQKGFVDVDNFLVLCVNDKTLIKVEQAVYSNVADLDNDGKYEIGGYHLSEAPCRECDSVYYNPAQIFELGESFSLDSLVSKQVTTRFYGVFLGYQPIDTAIFYKFH